ncbi:MAG TPA: toll/interleukin-1 receptor domain-containing protein [Pyrinomonadaceae bacterium]|nr:toll/interleukin-1 receptor domain-containing protein [Pyrinomonadaceae bacterium]
MKVFINNSQQAKPLARLIVKALRQAGLDVWYDEDEIYPGDNWAKITGEGLEASDAMVVLLTPDAPDSPNVQRNVSFALINNRYAWRVIPVLAGIDEAVALENFAWIITYLKTIKIPTVDKQEEGIDKITQALRAVA